MVDSSHVGEWDFTVLLWWPLIAHIQMRPRFCEYGYWVLRHQVTLQAIISPKNWHFLPLFWHVLVKQKSMEILEIRDAGVRQWNATLKSNGHNFSGQVIHFFPKEILFCLKTVAISCMCSDHFKNLNRSKIVLLRIGKKWFCKQQNYAKLPR